MKTHKNRPGTMKNQSRSVKKHENQQGGYRVVTGGFNPLKRRPPGGSDDFSLKTDNFRCLDV